jgi:hypothetical protein
MPKSCQIWKKNIIQKSLRKHFWQNFASEIDQKDFLWQLFLDINQDHWLEHIKSSALCSAERWRWSRRVRRVEWRKSDPMQSLHSSNSLERTNCAREREKESERERWCERKKRFGEWQEAMMIEPPARGRRLRPPAACALLWGAPGSPSWSALGPTQWAVVAEGAAGQGWTWLTAGGSFSLEHVPRALQCYLRATAANSNSSSRKSSPTKRTPPRMISKVSFFSHLCALFPPRVISRDIFCVLKWRSVKKIEAHQHSE